MLSARPLVVLLVLCVFCGTAIAQGFPFTLSGVGDDDIKGMAVDTAGNVYILGEFDGTLTVDPSTTLIDTDGAADGDEDIFVARFAPDGTLTLAFSFGSFFDEDPGAIAVDAAGNIHVSGSGDDDIDFDPGPGADVRPVLGTDEDPFIAKYDSNGSLLWAAMLPTTIGGDAFGTAVDASGNVYVSGSFDGQADFDPSNLAFVLPTAGPTLEAADNGFLWKLNASGALVWAVDVGGSGRDELADIALVGTTVRTIGILESETDIRVGGTMIDTTAANADSSRTAAGLPVPVLASFDAATGTITDQALVLGSLGDDSPLVFPSGLGVNGSGQSVISGDMLGEADFDPDPMVANTASSTVDPDGFLWTLNNDGSFASLQRFSGDAAVTLDRVVVTSDDRIIVGGDFLGTVTLGQDSMMNTVQLTASGNQPLVTRDAVIFEVSGSGEILWAQGVGGGADETADGLVTDANGNAYLSGQFTGITDLDPGAPTEAVASVGDDLFVTKVTSTGLTVRAPQSAGGAGSEDAPLVIELNLPTAEPEAVGAFFVADASELSLFSDITLMNPIAVGGSLAAANGISLYAVPAADFFGDAMVSIQSASSADALDKGGILDLVLPISSAPDVTGFTATDAGPTDALSVTFDLTFDEPVTGVDVTDFAVQATGVSGASVDQVTGSDAAYQVSVLTGTGDGGLRLALVDDGSIVDLDDGNGLTGSGSADGSSLSDTVLINKVETDLGVTAALQIDALGDPVRAIVEVTNDGPDAAVMASVSVTTGGFGAVTWTCTADSGAFCVSGGNADTTGSGSIAAMVDLPAGTALTYVLTGDAVAVIDGLLELNAMVAPGSSATDTNPANNAAGFSSTIGLFADGFE